MHASMQINKDFLKHVQVHAKQGFESAHAGLNMSKLYKSLSKLGLLQMCTNVIVAAIGAMCASGLAFHSSYTPLEACTPGGTLLMSPGWHSGSGCPRQTERRRRPRRTD